MSVRTLLFVICTKPSGRSTLSTLSPVSTSWEDGASSAGNRSAVHWNLVLIQTPEWGGGEVGFDEVLVRKDGLFVLAELEDLNPERLG